MGRKRLGTELFVFMNGEKVGQLKRSATGRLEFSYADVWLTNKTGRPISLSMPLTKQIYAGSVVENFFDNLLPDSQLILNRIQKRFGASSRRSFDILWHIGRDCVGALQFFPEDIQVDIKKVEAEPLSDEEIAETLRNYRTMPLGMRADHEFRISVAGTQEKAAFLNLAGKWCRPLGTTPTSHIFKLPIGHIEQSGLDLSDSVENEWLCHAIFKAYGLPVANTDMLTFDGTKVLVVERFDRRWAKDRSWLIRRPQEDMCQALNTPPALKYENDGGPGIVEIMQMLLGSNNSMEDRQNFMTQVLLFWLLGAIDGHAKNFSIFLQPGGAFQLTPAYDVISAYPLVAKKQLNAKRISMAMAVSGKNRHYRWSEIFPRHWLAMAKKCNFPQDAMNDIISKLLQEMDQTIRKVEAELPDGFPENVALAIFDGLRNARERFK